MKLNSLKILAILLGWLTVQSAVLSHEFSEEHWSSSASNHICLTQAAHLDDIVPSQYLAEVASFELELSKPESVIHRIVILSPRSTVNPRAPPTSV